MKKVIVPLLLGFVLVTVIGQGCNKFLAAVDENAASHPNQIQGSLSFTVNPETPQLIEGGQSTTISIQSTGWQTEEIRKVRLSGLDPQRNRYLSIAPEFLELSKENSSGEFKVSLQIGPLPFKKYQTDLNLEIETEGETMVKSVTIDILPVDAPNVFLLIGQSNMVGSSLTENESSSPEGSKNSQPGGLDEPHPKIFQLNVSSNSFNAYTSVDQFSEPERNIREPLIIRAEDPLHDSGNSGTQIGPGLTFAKAVLEITNQDIILIPAAFENTGFCLLPEFPLFSWNPSPKEDDAFGGTGLFLRAISRTNIALQETQGILRGILWQQGERDGYTDICSSAYRENLISLFSALRSQIIPDRRGENARGENSDIPIIVGTNSRGMDPRGDYSQLTTFQERVYQTQTQVSSFLRNAGTSVHDDIIPPEYPCGSGSCVHFGAEAYREIGTRYFQIYKTLNDSQAL